MTSRHLKVVSGDDDSSFEAAVQHAWKLFDRMYPNQESRRTMYGSLARIVRCYIGEDRPVKSFPWHWLVSDDATEDVWLPVRDGYSAKTAKKDAAAIKSLLKCYFRAGLLTAEQFRSATSFDSRIRRATRSRAGRGLDPKELKALTSTILAGDQPVKVARDVALLLVLASTGARRNEIANLVFEDVNLEKRQVLLRVTKNGAERPAWLHPSAVAALERWIDHRGTHTGFLFHPLKRNCEPIVERGLSAHQMWKIIREHAHAAGVDGLTPHDFRRFAVSTLLDLGFDLALVSRIVGHKQMTTTVTYDRRPEARCQEAVGQLPLPALDELSA